MMSILKDFNRTPSEDDWVYGVRNEPGFQPDNPYAFKGFQNGEHCPYCGSDNIETFDPANVTIVGEVSWYNVHRSECFACGRRFATVDERERYVIGVVPYNSVAESIFGEEQIKQMFAPRQKMLEMKYGIKQKNMAGIARSKSKKRR